MIFEIGKRKMAEPEAETGGFVNTLKDLFSGAAGGIAQVLLGELNVFLVLELFSSLEIQTE